MAGEIELNKIYNMDCLDGMKQLDDNSIDLVVTDPPYFTPPAQFVSGRSVHKRSLSNLSLLEHFYKDFFEQLIKKIRNTGTIYIFCDSQSYPLYYVYLYGFVKRLRLLVWDRGTAINGYTWRYRCQYILFAEMFDTPSVKTGDSDLLKYRSIPVKKRIHPAEKPIELLKKLIEKSSSRQALVLDPFTGSGSTLEASILLNRHFIGFEISKEYYDIANKRLKTISNINKWI